jgi:hypothetical protein
VTGWATGHPGFWEKNIRWHCSTHCSLLQYVMQCFSSHTAHLDYTVAPPLHVRAYLHFQTLTQILQEEVTTVPNISGSHVAMCFRMLVHLADF